MEVKIIDMDHRGSGICKYNNKICFVPKSIKDDVIDIEIVKSHKKYDEGRIKNIITKSDIRLDSVCPYYMFCGGCNISNLDYSEQLIYKKNKVISIFKRYLDMNINPNIIGSDNIYKYRNKITYHIDNGKIGLMDIDNKLISIDKCLLVSDRVNELYNKICLEDLSLVKKIIIKECDNGLILSINGEMEINNISNLCIEIYINGVSVYNKEEGYIFINDIKYLVNERSFFQVNTDNINKLYDVILKYGEFKNSDNVIDLYCGVGSISLYIAKYVNSVLGIEIIKEAIMDANNNARINNIDNAKFICGDVSKLIDDNIICDALIVDPPRIGLDSHSVDVINNSGVKKIIYVSCDPMTLVRDISKMDNYLIKEITLVDMFPQTHHVESVVLLVKK